jgi:polyhydroxyalkanoate synthesis regulator phasin
MAQPPAQTEEQLLELTHRARAISQEAGTKVTSAMRDMISASAGIAGFAVESARDLVQYMVRRGQMAQEEADRLMREAEAVQNKKPKAERDRIAAARLAADKAIAEKKAARLAAENALPTNKPLSKTVKTAPLKPLIPPDPMSEEGPAMKAEKVPAKVEKPAKAAAPAKVAAKPVAKAPASAKAPMKASAKAPAKSATKKAAAKPAKKAAKKKK